MIENAAAFLRDLKSAVRSLARAKGLTVAVVATLALGIGANAAMFTLVRRVLLRPLVNRDESRLIYIRQNANGRNAWFSIPEIDDIQARVKKLTSFGDFSIIGFTMAGLGEPRSVQAGVVGGSYFQAMGLRPVLGRLLDASDDGPNAAGAVVLTYRFWSTALNRDPSVIGKTVRLGSFIDSRSGTVVGVLEPCVPYPQDTEIISNIVTSQHHLSATMVTGRQHRMTELFARLAPGADLEAARAELDSVYKGMRREHPEAYPSRVDFQISAVRLRDELTSGARTILLVLMAASVLVFIIACSNAANLILARTVRRENELGIRAALGASTLDLRRVLLAEGLLLCVAGATIGLLIAEPMVNVLARYASRFSVRALDLSVDSSMVWVGVGLAVLAAALLAFVPRLPSPQSPQGLGMAGASVRITGTTNRRLKIFALVQVAACFVLVAASAATVTTLLSLESVRSAFDTRHVLAVNVPVLRDGRTPGQIVDYYREAMRQIRELPGVLNVALTTAVPWRDRGIGGLEFAPDGHVPRPDERHPHANAQVVSPGFFATLGLPLLAGRDFNDGDRNGAEPVAIVSQSLAEQIFPHSEALNHHVLWTDPMLKFDPRSKPVSRRIVGIVPDIDNRDFVPKPTMTIYHCADQDQANVGGRLLVDVRSDPYGLVQPITRVMRKLSADQPVERAKTLEDIRAEVLSPEKLNVVVSGVFAGVSLLIAIVGVAGVLAFSVSARTREFGIRLAVGSAPRHLLLRVIAEGAAMAIGGLALGSACGFALAQLAGSFLGELKMPGVLPVAGSALVLLLAAVIASAIPAIRAARVDVMQALRSE
ncbi:MAG TPA: ADOP family duplicated permease [Bryobacteraceae bacterium]|nr:ADOP family duplicated permease [Bryobacteraceae bacterium]